MEASTLCTSSKCTIILLHAVHDCPCDISAAIERHVSFAQITCNFLHPVQARFLLGVLGKAKENKLVSTDLI